MLRIFICDAREQSGRSDDAVSVRNNTASQAPLITMRKKLATRHPIANSSSLTPNLGEGMAPTRRPIANSSSLTLGEGTAQPGRGDGPSAAIGVELESTWEGGLGEGGLESTWEGELEGDCGRCAGLCCVALAFDRSELFGFGKEAGVPCVHLTAQDGCRIHATRALSGFSGCVGYDCAGAGQRATELFHGRHWRTDPVLARALFDAFRVLREIHGLLALLHTTARWPLSLVQRQRRASLCDLLQRACASSERLAEFERRDAGADARAFLSSLRDCVPVRRLPIVATAARTAGVQ
jgi:hypothetical protein